MPRVAGSSPASPPSPLFVLLITSLKPLVSTFFSQKPFISNTSALLLSLMFSIYNLLRPTNSKWWIFQLWYQYRSSNITCLFPSLSIFFFFSFLHPPRHLPKQLNLSIWTLSYLVAPTLLLHYKWFMMSLWVATNPILLLSTLIFNFHILITFSHLKTYVFINISLYFL